MICSCRSAPLRIFVQSLTPLQLPAATYRLNRPSLAASRQDGLVRAFRTASAAYYPRQPSHHVPRHNDPQHTQDQDLPGSSTGHGAASVSYADPEVPVVELDSATTGGALFELSQDTIDALSAVTERSYVTSNRGPKAARSRKDLPRSRTRAPIEKVSDQPYKTKRLNIQPNDSVAEREPDNRPHKKKEGWLVQKEALQEKFPEGWAPRKRLSPDALEGIKALHTQFPKEYTTPVLAAKFEVSPEVIRRILRANWTPSAEEEERRQERWFNRGKNIWSQMAELGKKPPKKWRQEGITRDPRWNIKRGPRTEYPFVPKWKEEEAQAQAKKEKISTQRKLGGRLL
ncbi:mitochondrion organization and biogenesis protein [Apiospora arundinis]|uniref:Required for respiratory growth protein 9, mitochondrial n=1 Tax=Apiospora arundinis TaxID=335852 RepID=A0ABR2IG74_9PEZI